MLDNSLFATIKAILDAGLAMRGLTDVTMIQSYQPVDQGVPEGRTLFLQKLFDTEYGFPGEDSEWNGVDTENTTELQYVESTFQLDALAIQDPAIVDQLTASDLA